MQVLIVNHRLVLKRIWFWRAFALCQLPSANYPLPIALCQMPSANCPLPFCPLPIALCHLPSANCPLPFSLCQLPSVKYPLPFALCRLPSVKCPLPITPFSGGHLEEGKWQRANGRGQMAEGIWHRGHLEEGFWKRVFGWGQFLGRAVRFGGHLEKSFWKRAFGRGQISGGQLACTRILYISKASKIQIPSKNVKPFLTIENRRPSGQHMVEINMYSVLSWLVATFSTAN